MAMGLLRGRGTVADMEWLYRDNPLHSLGSLGSIGPRVQSLGFRA